jgi:glycosyltransferase involved in cell wall biosynthesis
MSRSIVSVILPVHDGRVTLLGSIDSVLSQEFDDMEVILLDDGSEDDSWELIFSYSQPHVRAVRHHNIGLAATLNRGVAEAKGRFIARQDQDDLVLPGRFAKQIAFLQSNPDIAMVGTWSQIYSGDIPTSRYHRHPASNDALQLELLFDNPFVHSSMMIRADVLRDIGGYSEDKARQPPEDYELWSRIARKYRVANLPEVLTVYREVSGSMSRTGDNPFLNNVIRISSENLLHVLAPAFTVADCTALAELYHRGGMAGFKSTLSRTHVREMLSSAARAIAGPRSAWSAEFLSSYQRMELHLDSRFLRRRIPEPLVASARWLRNRLYGIGSRS